MATETHSSQAFPSWLNWWLLLIAGILFTAFLWTYGKTEHTDPHDVTGASLWERFTNRPFEFKTQCFKGTHFPLNEKAQALVGREALQHTGHCKLESESESEDQAKTQTPFSIKADSLRSGQNPYQLFAIDQTGHLRVSSDGCKQWQNLSEKLSNTLPFLGVEGHIAPIEAIAWSPDGKSFATGSWDGTTRIWETINNDWALGALEQWRFVNTGKTTRAMRLGYQGLKLVPAGNRLLVYVHREIHALGFAEDNPDKDQQAYQLIHFPENKTLTKDTLIKQALWWKSSLVVLDNQRRLLSASDIPATKADFNTSEGEWSLLPLPENTPETTKSKTNFKTEFQFLRATQDTLVLEDQAGRLFYTKSLPTDSSVWNGVPRANLPEGNLV